MKRRLSVLGLLLLAVLLGRQAHATAPTPGSAYNQWCGVSTTNLAAALHQGCISVGAGGTVINDQSYGGTSTGTIQLNIGRSTKATIGAGGLDAVGLTINSAPVRRPLIGNTTYYVRADGNDGNSGLANSAGGAWLTLLQAYIFLSQNIDTGPYTATVQVGPGSYAGFQAFGPAVGGSNTSAGIQFMGDTTTPANVTITSGIIASYNAKLMLAGFRFQSSTSNCLYASGLGSIRINGNVDFHGCLQSDMQANDIGMIDVTTPSYTISGNAQAHYTVTKYGAIEDGATTISLIGTPAFSVGFADAVSGYLLVADSANPFSGSATGPRFNCTASGVLDTSGQGNIFPGSTAGISTNGCQIDPNTGGGPQTFSAGLVGTAISGGSINGTPIGGTTPSTGAFTALSATNNFNGNFGITAANLSTGTSAATLVSLVNSTSVTAELFLGGANNAGYQTLAANRLSLYSNGAAGISINADNASAPILLYAPGGVTVSNGGFTAATMHATGTFTGADGGTWGSTGINGAAIGATTTASGKFTTLSAANVFNGSAGISVANTSTGTGASASIAFSNSGSVSASIQMPGANYSGYEALSANALGLYTNGTAGIFLNVDAAGPILLNAGSGVTVQQGGLNVTGGYKAAGTAGVSCGANTINLTTAVATGGLLTHC